MNPPNPKRPCHDVTSSSIQNPNSVPVATDFNQTEFDSIISSFILLPDSSLSTSIDCSLDRVLGQILFLATKASGDDSIQDLLIDRTRKLALSLQESTKRVSRMRDTLYNSNSWSLPHELTIKIFSMLDTKSLMKASACCTMFRECSLDPLCYSHIDLRTSTITKRLSDNVVCSLILRAGKELRSLQLGRVKSVYQGSLVTKSCLASIILNRGFNGGVLRSLHLYNLKSTGTKSLCDMLLACPNLTDLKIFNLKHILVEVLKTLTKNSHSILDRLFLHNIVRFTTSGVSCSTAEAFVSSCPNITSLNIEGFHLNDDAARILAEGFPKLNYMNLSTTPKLTGRVLRDMINSSRDTSPLKTLILRDCPLLDRQNDVGQFLVSLIKGDFKFIGHIDVSREHGYGSKETVLIKNLLMKLKEKRSDVTAVA
ncbi:F-box protein [Cardamine amara subsp. amara]|uniref:F-box protein n=1 Tax=Cardamine amara subsp. amara TaxID=228776 RepID=A0ABD1C6M6_CARAN